MTRSEEGAQKLVDLGATVAVVSAFDGAAVEEALRRSEAEAVIDQLTALPVKLHESNWSRLKVAFHQACARFRGLTRAGDYRL
jgi:hypothetical protein